jgi:hypothetical protein
LTQLKKQNTEGEAKLTDKYQGVVAVNSANVRTKKMKIAQ